MAEINLQDARALFTKKLIDVYQQRIRPTGFLRSFFPAESAFAKLVSIEVERTDEYVAVDILRGADGNRNVFAKSTEKVFEPPMYDEFFDATQLDLYDRVLGSQGNQNLPLFAALLNKVADRTAMMQDKIERAIELQCSQFLDNGIVVLKTGDSIDFKRRPRTGNPNPSIRNSNEDYFAGAAVDPFNAIERGCDFLRTVAKATGGEFNLILGQQAFRDLLNNTKFKERQNLFNMKLDGVAAPIRDSLGRAYHGNVSVGSYTVHFWTYPQYYKALPTDDTMTPYINTKKCILLPMNPRFKTAFGLVPELIDFAGQQIAQPQFVMYDYIDQRKKTHDFGVQAAPLIIPTAIDQVYTFQAVG